MKRKTKQSINTKYKNNKLLLALFCQTAMLIIIALEVNIFAAFTASRMETVDIRFELWSLFFVLVLPICLALAVANFFTFRFTYRFFGNLTKGMESVAKGDYSIKLSVKRSGPFKKIYEDFNKMVGELRSVNMLRNDFVNSYSHEFKTPIVSINGFANLLLEQEVTDEERRMYLQIIADESARLSELAGSSVLLTKLDSQQIVAEKSVYSLDEQIRECVIVLSHAWGEKNINVSGELEELEYNGSAELLRHVWLNIISNAVKYTPENGSIDISLKRKDGNAVAVIADTGIGMDEQTRSRIFEKYYRGDNTASGGGLGLGLSIVDRIVKICGGTVQVQSEPDKGSTFTVTLPMN